MLERIHGHRKSTSPIKETKELNLENRPISLEDLGNPRSLYDDVTWSHLRSELC